MKTLKIILIAIIMLSFFSCEKIKYKETVIKGQIREKDTEDVIYMNPELCRPKINVYEMTNGGDIIYGESYELISSTRIDENANFNFTIELHKNKEYFIGISDFDIEYYYNPSSIYYYSNYEYYKIIPGKINDFKLTKQSKSSIIP